MESIEVINEDLIKLIKEKKINRKRITQIFNKEFNLDDRFDLQKLLTIIEKYEESLKLIKSSLLSELSSKRTLVRCRDCNYVYKEENKSNYFCLKAREYLDHEVDEKITCIGYKIQ